ncbi:MAG: RnfABCDGE type electron transport complex subunit D [Oscillospiraceae bacterium]|nr:RnfABCDGE type electron transport complex subunit D [Oscillospiraceae bacterium]MBQ4545398.1 RnfABCDGE type electron transport complex subunit D [Oscillospiraceae bacterium]
MQIDNRRLLMSFSPHIKTDEDTRSIMTDVIIALLFPLIMAVYFFGWRAAFLTAVSVAACVGFERLYCFVSKKESTISDMSAVVTGMLLAMSLPVSVPVWTVVVGAFFAIVVVKMLYGGLGKNFLNPALAARAFLFSWPALVSVWIKPNLGSSAIRIFGSVSRSALSPDVIASVTPLGKMKQGFLPSVAMGDADVISSLRDVVVGNVAGCIGEVSAVVIIAAAIYLLIRRVITVHIPAAYIGTVAILTFLFPLGGNSPLLWMVYSVCSGGLIFGAVFMATDYTTSPVTPKGRILYGVGCGVLTVFIRYFGAYNEGVMFAILIMNCISCFLDRIVRPRRFGTQKKSRKAVGEDEASEN